MPQALPQRYGRGEHVHAAHVAALPPVLLQKTVEKENQQNKMYITVLCGRRQIADSHLSEKTYAAGGAEHIPPMPRSVGF